MKSIILAGGCGSRLWPLSRDMYPKQLLTLDNDYSLLQQTFLRLKGLVHAKDIVTITNITHYADIKLQLNKIDKENTVLCEPLSKNTLPAIASALKFLDQSENDDFVIILPSDHLIKDIESFQETIKEAIEIAKEDYIVTFGIKPTSPESGYGYVKTKEDFKTGFIVDKFIEKPNIETAKQYIKDEHFYWNSGIFMGKISVFLSEIKKYSPDVFINLENIKFEKDKIDYDTYEQMPSISIDYAIMEKSNKIALVELKSDWNDLGSWEAIYNIKPKDKNGNVLTGEVIVDNVKNSFIYSQKNIVAVSGLENIILVETEDAIMACKLDKSQNVKNLYEILKQQSSDTTKLHKTVLRPWGYYTCLNSGKGYLTKNICVLPKQRLSLQSHKYRSEHWVVLEGKALIILDGKKFYIKEGDSFDVPIGAKHSLQNPYDKELKIIEVQKGTFISEDDIVRYEDSYGRV